MREILNKKPEVREILKPKKLDVDEIIKEVLAGGEKTSDDLKQEVVKVNRVPYSTFRKHIVKLAKRGIIIETFFVIIPQYIHSVKDGHCIPPGIPYASCAYAP